MNITNGDNNDQSPCLEFSCKSVRTEGLLEEDVDILQAESAFLLSSLNNALLYKQKENSSGNVIEIKYRYIKLNKTHLYTVQLLSGLTPLDDMATVLAELNDGFSEMKIAREIKPLQFRGNDLDIPPERQSSFVIEAIPDESVEEVFAEVHALQQMQAEEEIEAGAQVAEEPGEEIEVEETAIEQELEVSNGVQGRQGSFSWVTCCFPRGMCGFGNDR